MVYVLPAIEMLHAMATRIATRAAAIFTPTWPMDLRKTARVLDLLRKHGVTHYRDADLEVTLGAPRDVPAAIAPPGVAAGTGALTLVPEEPRRETDIEAALHPRKYNPDEAEEENVA